MFSHFDDIDNVKTVINPGLHASFTREVQDFVKNLYHAGQTALHNKEKGVTDDTTTADKSSTLNPFTLTIHSNVACIDLLLWAIKDENGKTYLIL